MLKRNFDFKLDEKGPRSKSTIPPWILEIVETVLALPPTQQLELLGELQSKTGFSRRRSSRQTYYHMVRFMAAGDRIYTGLVDNISRDGIFIALLETDLKDLAKGQSIYMSFNLPEHADHGEPVKGAGEIVRVSKTGIGVKFNRIFFKGGHELRL